MLKYNSTELLVKVSVLLILHQNDMIKYLESLGSNGEGGHPSERDQAEALMLACNHLPESIICHPREKDCMLAEAASILQRLSDKTKLEKCHKMMVAAGSVFIGQSGA
ncbi:hypothetical protein AVEN_56840-1 [Araneus ventricosus]|uniref:Uncharacterized protein n=1 Tax=Araneus ventricosus TaxID=182803 RepID=A0A4Y2X085_ARAVE|nr:hypothetical protein AVEN_274387-1 [Araneus ventricosus]GBO42931.1 hypothetical protein AVEN_56840-1 [Araneus ventricosus]